MRILQVCPYDWHAPGGVQTHVRQLAAELRGRGHEVLVAAPGQDAPIEPWVRILGRPLRVPFNGTTAPICLSLSAVRRIWRLLREFDPMIVHAHEPLAPSVAGVAGLLTSAPLVATFHAHCDTRIGPWLYACGTWPLNRRVAAGIAVSSVAISCLSRRVRVPFRIVPNGVSREFFALDARQRISGPRRMLFAHRLEPRKGFRVALQAFVHLARMFHDFEFVVVGDGAERVLAENLAPTIRARVRMCGTLSREALVAEFGAASVFIAPAINGESFGVALIEAMAAGLPIVASDVGGYRDVLSEGGGTLVPPGDPRALADEVARILQSPDLRRELGVAGRVQAATYAWDRIADAVEDTYADAVASASSARQRVAI